MSMAAVESGTASNLESSTAAAGLARPPPLTQTDAITSLLSLSLAAAAASNIPTPNPIATSDATSASTILTASSIPITSAGSVPSPITVSSSLPKTGAGGKHHRRLASTGQTRRRLSDAREAGSRPVLALPVTSTAATLSASNANPTAGATSSAALSLASLSLSTSPPSANHENGHSRSFSSTYVYSPLAPKPSSGTSGETKTAAIPIASRHKSSSSVSGSVTSTTPAPSTSANGKPKKRGGIDYVCESCAKVYRHPNCLNKHRWEHTAQWREASKFVLSKHQQVQLLEAAAILSHMAVPEVGGKAVSLPDDRSEWPVFLSGGKLPKVGALAEEEEKQQAVQEQQQQRKAGIVIGANGANTGAMPPFGSIGRAHANSSTRTYALQPRTVTVNAQGTNARGISASAPNGPRMYDYAGVGVARATHVAPGLVGVPNPAASAGRKPQASRNYSGSGSSASRSRSRSGSASASNSNGSDLEAAADDVDIEVDVVGEDVDEDEVDGMSLDGEENVKQKTPSAASAAFTYSPYYPSQQLPPSSGLGGQSPGGYHAYGSYGSYGSGLAGSFGTPSSAYGGGFSSSYSRRGGSLGLGMGMKREEDEMSIGFSVREEDEEEDQAERSSTREEEEEEEETMSMGIGIGGAMSSKKFGPVSSLRETSVGASLTSARSMSTRKSMRTRTLTEKARERVVVVEERKWDGMEMDVDNMDMD